MLALSGDVTRCFRLHAIKLFAINLYKSGIEGLYGVESFRFVSDMAIMSGFTFILLINSSSLS